MNAVETTLERLRQRQGYLRQAWASKEPFGYVVIDDFLPSEFAEEILAVYPPPDVENWDSLNYTHQRKKFTRTSGFPDPIGRFFALTAAQEFRDLLSEITGIPKLFDDPELLGGGLHQTLRGGFLDVHVDFNQHPRTKLHRRLNLLLYMNKDWRPEYQGYLELWDLASKGQLENMAPAFNRVVIFETNEVSYHGHPEPLNTPPHITRKSLAVYYYTKKREVAMAPEHDVLFRQTLGIRGYLALLTSSGKGSDVSSDTD